jgi:hypothetical protein
MRGEVQYSAHPVAECRWGSKAPYFIITTPVAGGCLMGAVLWPMTAERESRKADARTRLLCVRGSMVMGSSFLNVSYQVVKKKYTAASS